MINKQLLENISQEIKRWLELTESLFEHGLIEYEEVERVRGKLESLKKRVENEL